MQRCSKCKRCLADASFGFNTKGDLFRTCYSCRESQKQRRANNKHVILGVYDNTEPTIETETTGDSKMTPEDKVVVWERC